MEALVLVVHVLAAVAIIGLVLIQQGKGADAGASFGGGASQTVFGSQGGGSFFGKLTAVFALVFFITSFGLAFFEKNLVFLLSRISPDSIQTDERMRKLQN